VNANTEVGWSIVHAAIGIVLVIFGTWHAVLHRRALLRYLRERTVWAVLPTREAFAALALIGGVLSLTVTQAIVAP
jgi:hypothetical protein